MIWPAVVGQVRGILKVNKPMEMSEPYTHYEFVTVKCSECSVESNPFVYKDHLETGESLEYIQEITGFTIWSDNVFKEMGLVSREKTKGGLLCPICLEDMTKEKN